MDMAYGRTNLIIPEDWPERPVIPAGARLDRGGVDLRSARNRRRDRSTSLGDVMAGWCQPD